MYCRILGERVYAETHYEGLGLAPLGLDLSDFAYPRLAAWAVFLRRFAAALFMQTVCGAD